MTQIFIKLLLVKLSHIANHLGAITLDIDSDFRHRYYVPLVEPALSSFERRSFFCATHLRFIRVTAPQMRAWRWYIKTATQRKSVGN